MAALATLAELEAYLGRTITGTDGEDQATLLLELASDAVRNYTRQTISRETTTDALRAGCGPLTLPERPVVTVDGVTVDGAVYGESGYRVVGNTIHWASWPVNASLNRPAAPELTVDVEYTHGFDPVPGDIKAVVLAAAARSIEAPTGVKQESLGSYSVTYAGDGGVVLLTSEQQLLNRYRQRTW